MPTTLQIVKPTRRPVVLLVQPVRDDGLEMYAEFLRFSGLAAIAVSNAQDAMTFAPEADIIVTGIVLDGTVDGVELVSRLRGETGTCTSRSSCSVRGGESGVALGTRGATCSS
jgi:hypothetical protein